MVVLLVVTTLAVLDIHDLQLSSLIVTDLADTILQILYFCSQLGNSFEEGTVTFVIEVVWGN